MAVYWPPGFWPSRYWPRGFWPDIPPSPEEAIEKWARAAFGFDVLWLDQDGPRLPAPYATLHWFSDQEIGLAQRIHTQLALDVEEQVQEVRRLTIQIEVYTAPATVIGASEAMDVMESALLTLQAEQVTRGFREAGMSFLSHEVILNLDEFDGDRWERRALCDVHFLHLLTSDPESVGRIDTAVPTYNISE